MEKLSREERAWVERTCKQDKVDYATIFRLFDPRDNYERYALCISWDESFEGECRRVCKYLKIKEGNYFEVKKNLLHANYEEIDLEGYDPTKNRSGLYIKEDYIVMRWL